MAPFSLLPSCWCFCCALSPWSFTLYTSPLPIFKSHQSCPFLELNSNVIISNWLTMVYKNSADIKNTALGVRELNVSENVLQLYLIYGALLKKCWKSIMSFVSKKKWPFFHLLKKVSEGSRRVIFFLLPTYKSEYFLWLRSIMLFITLCKTRKPIQFPIIQPGISILVVYLPNWIVFTIRRYSFHLRTKELFYIDT